jgi:hypothetical protein
MMNEMTNKETATMNAVTIDKHGAFKCRCGNTPETDGAYPCQSDGTVVEPTPEEWDGNLYVCFGCDLIFDGATGKEAK